MTAMDVVYALKRQGRYVLLFLLFACSLFLGSCFSNILSLCGMFCLCMCSELCTVLVDKTTTKPVPTTLLWMLLQHHFIFILVFAFTFILMSIFLEGSLPKTIFGDLDLKFPCFTCDLHCKLKTSLC